MDPPVYVTATPSNNYGAWALVLVIIVIIIIIILAVVFARDTAAVANLVNYWTVQPGGTASEGFVASPNSIYIANTAAPSGITITINAYPDIAANLATSNRATEFKISNNVPSGGTRVLKVNTTSDITFVSGTPSPTTIAAGTTATYIWLSPTSIQRLS